MAKRVGMYAAYDRSTFDKEDRAVLEDIAPFIDGVKFGYQSIYAEVQPSRRSVMSLGREFCNDVLDKKTLLDGKLHDIGNTVEQALTLLGTYGCDMVTLHAQQSPASLAAAVRLGREYNVLPLAVTVLTDINEEACYSLFGRQPSETVAHFAAHAYAQGIRGFICSVLEARHIRRATSPDVIIGTPGIRPKFAAKPDEQKRIATPTMAREAGADFIVVGRPIFKPPQGMSCREAAKLIRAELDGNLPPGC